MNDPISAIFARERSYTLATSALPDAPVQPVRTSRRRRTLDRLRRRALSG
jgi:hypothetical protein